MNSRTSLDPRHLILLRELATRGSISAVAKATHRTPSALSQQLRTMTRELGIAVIEPQGRGVRLTEAGRLLADAAVEVDVALERARARVDALLHQPGGRVRVKALPSAAEYLFSPVMAALAGEPIELEFRDMDVSERSFAELAHDCEIVVGHSLVGEIPVGAEDLVCVTLTREPLDIALPDVHPLAARSCIVAEDLAEQSWIGVPDGFPFDTIVQAIARINGKPAHFAQRVIDNRVVESLVAAGFGIALLPRFTTRQRQGLVLRPLEGMVSRRWVVAMMRADRAERVVVQRVLAELIKAGRNKEDRSAQP